MNLFIDSHTFLWFAEGDTQLSTKATSYLCDPSNQLFLSVASLWEIAIKLRLGKIQLLQPFSEFAAKAIAGYEITLIPISLRDCDSLIFLPMHHRDPFDRLIITQCIRLGMTLVGCDTEFDKYGVHRVW